ncbi:MAG TPA: maleylpyruvate isomerase family mycothiol-dependent enzyme, partial [Streptosporangiaceae bacterium]
HLAQTEEAVVASVDGAALRPERESGVTVDQLADDMVRAQRADPAVVFERWRAARRAAVRALRAADPGQPLSWVQAPVKPATMATTRLAEHWAHGLDITGALDIAFPDTDRLRHIAWLAHRTLPYAFALAGGETQAVRCDLTAPDGVTLWEFGPDTAGSAISGPAGDFCRVAAQRLAPERSGLKASGPHGAAALRLLRTYAA